jgi:TPR repeat protein
VSSPSQLDSVPPDEAGTGKPTLWRAIKARRLSATLTRPAFARPLSDANAALRRGDYETAYTLIRPLADRGLAVAELVLGVMHGGGHGAPQSDAEAASWLQRAANQGCAEAQTILGVMYAKGQGVNQDDAKAAKWFLKAAEQGHAAAQSNLGLFYAQGRGVSQSDAEAAKWFHKAADQGLVEAQTILGLMYVKGQGVAQSYLLAHMWLNLAAAQGEAEALADRDQLARMMTPAQIAEAQRLAQERTAT